MEKMTAMVIASVSEAIQCNRLPRRQKAPRNDSTKKAFSLAELLITLIIVSCILAAFAPVITKRMANGGVSIGGGGGTIEKTIVESNVTVDGLTDDCENSDCTLCIANACLICDLTCNPPLAKDYLHCKCVDCSPFDDHCAQCSQTACKKCINGYKMVNNHCVACSDLDDGYYCDGAEVKECPKGYYCIDGAAKKCPENTYNDSTKKGMCTDCPSGKYATEGSTSCISCTAAYGSNCTECNPKECTACKAGYMASGKGCVEEDASILGYNGLYIYKYNAGDEGGPEIPDTVKVVNAGTSCSGDCCWKATDTKNTSSSCTSVGNSNSTYSGCTRTMCTYNAAVKICSAIGWRLPKASEGREWYALSANLGKAGLQLCDDSSSNYKNVMCQTGNNPLCLGGYSNYCRPGILWAQSADYIELTNGAISTSSWSSYTGIATSVRCVLDVPYELPEGCDIANSDGNCRKCKSGYKLSGGQCEFTLDSGSAMRYNGLYITKYNAGDEMGAPIPNSVAVVTTNTSCSGKCCWKVDNSTNTSSSCTSTGNGDSKYSGCTRTVCNYNAAVDICAQVPGGGWRLPTAKEGMLWYYASADIGTTGLQLCDDSSSNYNTVMCQTGNGPACMGGYSNYCRPGILWAQSADYIELTNGAIYTSSWSSYTGIATSVRCVKPDPDFPEGCLIAHPTITDRCITCKVGHKLSGGKCISTLETPVSSMRYNGLLVNKYNAGDENGVPIPDSVTTVKTGVSCSGKCCWKVDNSANTSSNCTSSGNGDSKYSGCTRTVCNYNAAIDICSQAPGGNWRLPTASEGSSWYFASADLGKSGLQLCDESSSNYDTLLCGTGSAPACLGGYSNYCRPAYIWAYQAYYINSSSGTIYTSDWSSYTSIATSVRCVKPDPDFPDNCLIADPDTANKCITCKVGYTLSNGSCIYDLETDEKSLRYNGLIITKYNAGDEGGPPIPDTVRVARTGDSCSGKCCWTTKNSNTNTSSSCTTSGNGDSKYSGCNRTVCNYSAAIDICANVPGGNWRLPKYNEGLQWYTISSGLGKSGLQLCDESTSNYSNVLCGTGSNPACLGGYSNYCRAAYVWAQSAYYINLSSGNIYTSDWSSYTNIATSIRCVKDDVNYIEGCLIANDQGKCTQCKSGYTVKNGACEYNMTYLEHNGLKITKYNAGDLLGPPIPNTVNIANAGASCSGKCCWQAKLNNTSADNCTSSYGSGTDYSGCTRTVCNWSAAVDICSMIPDGGWRLPVASELELIKNAIPDINTGKGKNGLQLCDGSNASSGTVYCPNVARCMGSANNYCYPNYVWGESTYYWQLAAGALSYGNWSNAGYAASVRCVK